MLAKRAAAAAAAAGGETIHSGHFMVSHFEAEAQDDEDNVAVPVLDDEDDETVVGEPVQPPKRTTVQLAVAQQPQLLSIDTSLSKLFQCMSLAYRQKLTSPKWNRFRGIRLRWKDKIRLNNVIWRCWHMQFIKKENTLICQFASPLDVDTHNKPEAVVLEGKYWKRKLAAVTAEYKRWRMFYRNHALGHTAKDDLLNEIRDMEMDLLVGPDSNVSECMMTDEDYMSLFTDTLFSAISQQPFAFPDAREIVRAVGSSDFIQPSLGPLQPNLDAYVDMAPFNEFLLRQEAVQPPPPTQPPQYIDYASLPYSYHPPPPTPPPLPSPPVQVPRQQQQPPVTLQKLLATPQGGPSAADFDTSLLMPQQYDFGATRQQRFDKLQPSGYGYAAAALPQQQQPKARRKSATTAGVYQQKQKPVAAAVATAATPLKVKPPLLSSASDTQLLRPKNTELLSWLVSNGGREEQQPQPQQQQWQDGGDCGVAAASPKSPSNSSEHRRAGHIHAEQKRRYNIKNGFDMLHSLIPQLQQGAASTSKLSKAAMLQKGGEYIRQLRQERAQLEEEMAQLREQIDGLNAAISNCQSMLPATGAPVARRRDGDGRMRRMFDEHVRRRTADDYKYWIMGLIFKPLLASFALAVSTASLDEMYKSTMVWVEQHCSLVDLRPLVMNSLKSLSTSTDVLNAPEALPDEIRSIASGRT